MQPSLRVAALCVSSAALLACVVSIGSVSAKIAMSFASGLRAKLNDALAASRP